MVSLAPSPETLGTPLPTEPQWVQYGGWGKNRCERRQNGQQAGWRGPSGLGETSTNINHRRLGVGEGHDSWIPLVDGRPESGSESSSRPKRGAPSWASPGQLLRHATLHPCPLVSTNAGTAVCATAGGTAVAVGGRAISRVRAGSSMPVTTGARPLADPGAAWSRKGL